MLSHLFLSSSLSLSYFLLAIPMRKCLGKHLCMSSSFHIVILNDTCFFLCSNVRGLSVNLSDLTVALSQYDILLCSETLVSEMRHVSEVLVPGFGRPVL